MELILKWCFIILGFLMTFYALYYFIAGLSIKFFLMSKKGMIREYNIRRRYVHEYEKKFYEDTKNIPIEALSSILGIMIIIFTPILVYAFFNGFDLFRILIIGICVFYFIWFCVVCNRTKEEMFRSWEDRICPHCGAPLSLLKNESVSNEKYFTIHVHDTYTDEHGKSKTQYIPVDYVKYNQHSNYECIFCHESFENVKNVEKRI